MRLKTFVSVNATKGWQARFTLKWQLVMKVIRSGQFIFIDVSADQKQIDMRAFNNRLTGRMLGNALHKMADEMLLFDKHCKNVDRFNPEQGFECVECGKTMKGKEKLDRVLPTGETEQFCPHCMCADFYLTEES